MTEKQPVTILASLEAAGFEAYYVGGCVRDLQLGRAIHDWDITTSALPAQTMACFSRCIPTGLQHGTVTVIEDGCQAEVTTFRCDGSYADSRHPEQVTFVRTLAEDLSRRDFTINAMAMDRRGTLTDLFGGLEDLRNRRIRCVGNPDVRFQEDALRMFRALRFAAQLNFSIDSITMEAIPRNSALSRKLSAERIREELEKALLTEQTYYVGQMIDFGLLRSFGLETDLGCTRLAELPPVPTVRWAGLCRLYPELDLHALRLDKKTARTAMTAASLPCPDDRLGWKRLLSAHGTEIGLVLGELMFCRHVPDAILASGECLTLRELAVSGRDFPQLHGPALGRHLAKLLDHVLQHPEDNCRETLLLLPET